MIKVRLKLLSSKSKAESANLPGFLFLSTPPTSPVREKDTDRASDSIVDVGLFSLSEIFYWSVCEVGLFWADLRKQTLYQTEFLSFFGLHGFNKSRCDSLTDVTVTKLKKGLNLKLNWIFTFKSKIKSNGGPYNSNLMALRWLLQVHSISRGAHILFLPPTGLIRPCWFWYID